MESFHSQNFDAHGQQKCNNHLLRSWTVIKSAFLAGFLIGGYRGGHRANIRYLAEQQHILSRIRTKREAISWIRRRNSIMAVGVAREGLKRGGQLAMMAGIFEGGRWMMREFRERQLMDGWEFIDDIGAGMAAGSMFVFVANNRQRIFYLRKGLLLGGILGLGLGTIDWLIRTLQKDSDQSIITLSSTSSL